MNEFGDTICRKPNAVGKEGIEIRAIYTQTMKNYFDGSSVYMMEKKKRKILQDFNKYKIEWENLTMFSSSISEIIDNDPYRNIIGLGIDAVPFILNDLVKTQNFWFYALNKITGENPIQEEHSGQVELMVKDWLNWANKNQVC